MVFTAHPSPLAAVLATSASLLLGCSGGSSSAGDQSSASTTDSATLYGDYVRSASSKGDIQEILFADATHYTLLPVGCAPGNNCTSRGTYTFDGADLTLTEGTSGKVTSLPIAVLSTQSSATTGTKDLRVSTGDGLVSGSSGGLVTAGSGATAQLVSGSTPLECPAGQSCASSVQAGNNTLNQAQPGANSSGDDDDPGPSTSGEGGNGTPNTSGPCDMFSGDTCSY